MLLCCLAIAGEAVPLDSARADSAAPPDSARVAPPVEELVALALERAPSIAAMDARAVAAREMVAPAGALPDPTVELMLQDEGFPDWTVGKMPMSMIGPQISQGIPFPGKRGARREAARDDAMSPHARVGGPAPRRRPRSARDLRSPLRARPGSGNARRRTGAPGLLSETVIARQSVGSPIRRPSSRRVSRGLVWKSGRVTWWRNARWCSPPSTGSWTERGHAARDRRVAPHSAAPAAAWDSLAVHGSSQVMVREAG